MDSASYEVTASDIQRIKEAAFASATRPVLSRQPDDLLPEQHLRPDDGKDDSPQEPLQLQDPESGLPSTVPDSQVIVSVDDLLLQRPDFLKSNAVPTMRAMSTPFDLTSGTQPISQSIYESIIQRGKSARIGSQHVCADTQQTYEQGDSGHVDITSSFVTRPEQSNERKDGGEPEDLGDPEPVEFSPIPSQHPLTQFPESQRFKTPATAGKKRKYSGDVLDTPAPIGNPLLRTENTTPSGLLGLSQAFAATQAPSSPFTNGPPTAMKSDRPSPNLELQTRLANGPSSSPLLRPINDLKRAVTEPATRYVPMRQSQAEREHYARLAILEGTERVNVLDDDFDDEDSLLTRKRRQREREQRARQELKSLSSPLMPARQSPASSPPNLLQLGLASEETAKSPTGSPIVTSEMDPGYESVVVNDEAETEQEVIELIDTEESSQLSGKQREDKENASVLVPKTILRQKFRAGDAFAIIDASPTLRRTDNLITTPIGSEMNSSGPFRIADSQASQSRSRLVRPTSIATHLASEVADSGDRWSRSTGTTSAAVLHGSIDQSVPNHAASTVSQIVQWPEENGTTNASIPSTRRDNTVPETSSDLRVGISKAWSEKAHSNIIETEDTAIATTHYETAQSRLETDTDLQASSMSSPIRTTPPGRKRRRLMDISAEPSPRRLNTQPSFDAEAVLRLDDDQNAAILLESSPYRKIHMDQNEVPQDGKVDAHVRDGHVNQPGFERAPSHYADDNSEVLTGIHDSKHIAAVCFDISPDASQEVVRPGRLRRVDKVAVPVQAKTIELDHTPAASRRSLYDIQASPQERIRPRLQPKQATRPVADKLKRRSALDSLPSRMQQRLEAGSRQKQRSGSPDIEVESDDIVLPAVVGNKAENHNSIIAEDKIVASSMVFAYYKGDPRGYYPARLLGTSPNNGYEIQWEGYDPASVDGYGIKALDLRMGDVVKVLADGFAKIPYVIKGFKDKIKDPQGVITDIRGHQTLIISPKHRKSLTSNGLEDVQREVAIAYIYLDVNMWAQLKTRDQKFEPCMSSAITAEMGTPLLRSSTPGTPSSRGRRPVTTMLPQTSFQGQGIFSNKAFAISYDDPAQRNKLGSLVQSNGGTMILDSFHDLLEAESVQLKAQHANLGFTALLTDRHSRKEKYMQALALGLPCLSGRWVEACVKYNTLLNWQSYLLPAGESAELDNFTRSRVLPSTVSDNTRLDEMISLRPNFLDNQDVIVVTGRGKAEIKRAPYLFLVQTLGPGQIHKVPDLQSVKELLDSDRGQDCHWAFVDDKDVSTLQTLLGENNIVEKTTGKAKKKTSGARTYKHCKVAGNELIVQSLILGRLSEL